MKKQFASSMDEKLFKELKVYAAEWNHPVNDVIESALELWFAITNDKGWKEVADCMPSANFTGSRLQQYAYDHENEPIPKRR